MKKTQAGVLPSSVRALKLSALAAATSMAISAPVFAFQFESENGEITGAWDTTVTYGIGVRIEDRDDSIIGISNGGTAASVNGDDGNLNFDKGDVFSNAIKVSSDIEVNYKDYGAFFRINALYDQVLANSEFDDRPNGPATGVTGVRELSDDANDLLAERLELFDAFIFGDFEIAEKPGTFKLGNQILSWGESTFIQNSINVINPIDVSKLRVPGAELKEALIPVPIISGSIDLTENTNLEAFYQLEWEPFRIDPGGSFFATNDFAGEGGGEHGVLLGFGVDPDSANLPGQGGLNVIQREPGQDAKDDGQFGFAFRFFAPELNDSEFGFYFLNYHSRRPITSARAASAQGVANAFDPSAGGNPDDPLSVLSSVEGGARYFLEYPEDIQLYGLSFNTSIGTTGIALQGEVSHRVDQPLQVDDIELLFAGVSAAGAEAIRQGLCTGLAAGGCLPLTGIAPGNQFTVSNNGIDFAPGQDIPGFVLRDVTQVQSTATKAFGNVFGANRLILLSEIAGTYIHNLPDDIRLEVPGTFISGNESLATAHGGVTQSASDFGDEFSWGYRLAGRLEYFNALGPVNLFPVFSFQHDVEGNTPAPILNFLEDRTALTVGLNFDYQNEWSGGIAITTFGGAGDLNLNNDRDFVAANVKYSF